jgi:hypothetical protein
LQEARNVGKDGLQKAVLFEGFPAGLADAGRSSSVESATTAKARGMATNDGR